MLATHQQTSLMPNAGPRLCKHNYLNPRGNLFEPIWTFFIMILTKMAALPEYKTFGPPKVRSRPGSTLQNLGESRIKNVSLICSTCVNLCAARWNRAGARRTLSPAVLHRRQAWPDLVFADIIPGEPTVKRSQRLDRKKKNKIRQKT